MIILLSGAVERLVGVSKTYQWLSVVAQGRQWMQLEAPGLA